MDSLAGIREGGHGRRAGRACLFEYKRRSDETLSQYVSRREQQFTSAAAFDLELPGKFKAILLEEGACFSEQGEQNLRTLTGGTMEYDKVVKALRDLGTTRVRLTMHSDPQGGKNKSYLMNQDDSEGDHMDSVYDGDDLDTDDEEYILAEIDKQEVNENDVPHVLAEIQKFKRRTWSENKELKKSFRKDRQLNMKGDYSGKVRASGGPRKRLTIEQLKLVTRCGNCLERGHWHKECTKPKQERTQSKGVGFVYSANSSVDHASGLVAFTDWSEAIREGRAAAQGLLASFLSVEPGLALVDTAAGQAIMGIQSFEKHRARLHVLGLRPLERIGAPLPKSFGIGGKGTVLKLVLVPIGIQGKHGVVEFVILEQDVPPLLPVGLLEMVGADILLSRNVIKFRGLQVAADLRVEPSKHRSMRIDEFDAPFRLSEPQLAAWPGVKVDSFDARQDAAAPVDEKSSVRAPCARSHSMKDSNTLACVSSNADLKLNHHDPVASHTQSQNHEAGLNDDQEHLFLQSLTDSEQVASGFGAGFRLRSKAGRAEHSLGAVDRAHDRPNVKLPAKLRDRQFTDYHSVGDTSCLPEPECLRSPAATPLKGVRHERCWFFLLEEETCLLCRQAARMEPPGSGNRCYGGRCTWRPGDASSC
eukprot:TRINITY_DN25898_c0_g1_i6.p1 TRINITY_DN25898_c0_g1~~TRINITY_DN25898_c0_g1_i6.p1  ORF type:complete len:645 (+),score=91.04 TRINITY_DN25898_c0_g1_i6:1624-3558(+)